MTKETKIFDTLTKIPLKIEKTEDTNKITLIGRALSSPIRIEILRLLNKGKALLLSEIAEELNLQVSSTAFHLSVLEDANLVNVEFSTKRKGTLKYFSYNAYKEISIILRNISPPNNAPSPIVYNIPIGSFVDAKFTNSCGISTANELIMENNPNNCFIPNKIDAQIIWNKGSGYLTYAIPNDFAFKGTLAEVNLSLELCSETNGYNADYPSDITFSINGVELCTYLSLGDYGDHYGKYTPPWWYIESTKYGVLTNISIRSNGVYLNEKLVNKKINLDNLNLTNDTKILFTLQVKENAEHVGGFNIFGEKFGDYNQAIVFNALYKKST
ncbi:MAG: helix-turn-helix domain-containing protein [Clostridia bacterium]|nr:helix-turn-helix domain-containing protein [Clostridia bacterium]